MVLGKRWLFSIGNGTEIVPLEKGRKSPVRSSLSAAEESFDPLLYTECTAKTLIGLG